MRASPITFIGFVLWILGVGSIFAQNTPRVLIAPVQGNAKYPLVMNGLRQVLLADLAQTGQFTIVDESPPIDQLNTARLTDLSSSISADSVLFIRFNEGVTDFTVSLRANDVATGYNLGARDLRGTYADIKTLQDVLLNSALILLRTSIPESQKTDIVKSHTKTLPAIMALGQADAAISDKRYVDAVTGFAKARALDQNFRAASYQMQYVAPKLVQKLKEPDQIGKAYSYLGDSLRSTAEYDRALGLNPNNVSALIGKAELFLQLGKLTDSLALFTQANKLEPNNSAAMAGLARTYQAMGKTDEALRAFEKAKHLGTSSPEVYEKLGTLYARKGQAKAAAEAYRTAGEFAQKAVDYKAAQRLYSEAQRLSPQISTLERQADSYIANGEYILAIDMLKKALLVWSEPNKDSIFVRLGYVYYLSGEIGSAIKNLSKAIELNPNNYEGNLYLGVIYSSDPDPANWRNAIKYLETASRIKPNEPDPKYYLAQLYIKDNRPSTAIALLEKLIQSRPQDPVTHKNLGDCHFLVGDLPRAEKSYNRAIELNADYKEALEGLARTYIRQGNHEKAFATIDRVYTIDAANNIFLREGIDLLGGLVSRKLIELVLRFPKIVTTDFGTTTINQVGVVHLYQEKKWTDKVKEAFEPYTVDTKRIRRDIEFALLSQFRVLSESRLGPFSSGKLLKTDFDTETFMEQMLPPLKMDGLFGFEIFDYQAGTNSDQVTVDLFLYSLLEKQALGISDKATLPVVYYPKEQIIRFNQKCVLAYALAFLIVFTPIGYFTIYRVRTRGWGNVKVIINYDPKLESFLTLKLSTKQEKERDTRLVIVKDKAKYEKKKYKEFLKQRGTWVRQMVGKVTLFERVPAREYYCYLYGTIEDTALTKSTIGNYYMVQKVVVIKGQTKELVFQLEKEEAFVTVFVRKGEEDIAGAEIWVSGDPMAKYSRGEAGTFIYLKKGKHKIVVTHEGRKAEQAVDIYDLSDKTLFFDLLTIEEAEENALSGRDLKTVAQEFQDQGRLEDAAKLYEKAGVLDRAGEVRAQALLSEGNTEEAALVYAKAKDFLKAADLYEQLAQPRKANTMYGYHYMKEGKFEEAAKYLEQTENHAALARIYTKLGLEQKALVATANDYLVKGQKIEAAQTFVKVGDFARAAEIYEDLKDFPKAAMFYAKDGNYQSAGEIFAQGGDKKRAALAFEKGGLYEQAISLYQEMGETDKLIELLKQAERYYEAASLCYEQGLIDDAIAICQKVSSSHLDISRSRLLMGRMLAGKGLNDMALKTFAEAYESTPQDFDSDSLYFFATLLEQEGQFAQALEIFEGLLKRDFHYKDVSIKVKDLKPKAQVQLAATSDGNVNATIGGQAPSQPSRYEIIEEIGRGAMGIVYKAKDRKLDRIVALKTLPHTLKDDSQALESLKKEAQTAAKLNHPNIVTIFDVGQENGTYYIAMEYVQGKTLQQVLKHVKKMDFKNFCLIAKPLCEVITYAHSQRIIHRDIKPSNIILLPSRSVKLMDFGLAKVLQDISIDKTMLRGTPLYMSPEQVLGKDIDHRADIYAMGIIFYEMLSGSPPFTKGDILYAHLHQPPPPLSEVPADVPKNATETIMACLAKDKAGRPMTAEELLKGLFPS